MKKTIGVLVGIEIPYSNKDGIFYIDKYNGDGTVTLQPIDPNKSRNKQTVEHKYVTQSIPALTKRDSKYAQRHHIVDVVRYKKHFKLIKVSEDGYVTELLALEEVIIPGDSIRIYAGSKLKKEFNNKFAEVITIHKNAGLTVRVEGYEELFRIRPENIISWKPMNR